MCPATRRNGRGESLRRSVTPRHPTASIAGRIPHAALRVSALLSAGEQRGRSGSKTPSLAMGTPRAAHVMPNRVKGQTSHREVTQLILETASCNSRQSRRPSTPRQPPPTAPYPYSNRPASAGAPAWPRRASESVRGRSAARRLRPPGPWRLLHTAKKAVREQRPQDSRVLVLGDEVFAEPALGQDHDLRNLRRALKPRGRALARDLAHQGRNGIPSSGRAPGPDRSPAVKGAASAAMSVGPRAWAVVRPAEIRHTPSARRIHTTSVGPSSGRRCAHLCRPAARPPRSRRKARN